MVNPDIRLDKVVNGRHGLTSAKIQLDLLSRLLSDSSISLHCALNENSEVFNAIEDVGLLMNLVIQKIDIIYRCVSTEFQLPLNSLDKDFCEVKKSADITLT